MPSVHAIVISDKLWRTSFSADPAAIGERLTLASVNYRIAGVAPPDFRAPGTHGGFADLDYYTVLPENGAGTQYQRGYVVFSVVARLRPAASVTALNAQLRVIGPRLASRYPADDRGVNYHSVSLTDALVGSVRFVLFAVFAAVTGVLLVACANIGNLLLSRSASRDREFAVRSALGASRGRLLVQLLVETFSLAVIGGCAGLALAWGAVTAFVALAPADIPRLGDISIDATSAFYTLGVVVLVTLLAGLAPAFASSPRNIATTLKSAGRGGDASSGRAMRNGLVAFEVALTLALVVAAGLVLRSFTTLTHQPLGFVPRDVAAVGGVTIPDKRYPSDRAVATFLTRVATRAAAVPGVSEAAWAVAPPFAGNVFESTFAIVGGRATPAGDQPAAAFNIVGPEYFAAVRQPVQRGREFTDSDRLGTQGVAIVNEAFVRTFMPRGSVIGRRVTTGVSASSGSNMRTIVGVVGDARTTYAEAAPPTIYLPILQVPFPGALLIVRGQHAADAVAALVPAVDPLMPVPRVRSLDAMMGGDAAQARLSAASIGILALVALLLALAGIYAVVSYNVAQRTHEIGVRMALGANVVRVRTDVIGRAMMVAGTGVLAGIVIAVFVARTIGDELYGVSPFDPLTFAFVIVVIVVASIAAAFVPARRATRVNPVVALRYE